MDEIRSYHYDPEKFEPYRKWALEEAIPFLKDNLNIVGFWLDNGKAPEVGATSVLLSEIGVVDLALFENCRHNNS